MFKKIIAVRTQHRPGPTRYQATFLDEVALRGCVVRSATTKDFSDLFPLAQKLNSVNLPSNSDALHDRLLRSESSFLDIHTAQTRLGIADALLGFSPGFFQFVMEDAQAGEILGSKLVGACNIEGSAGTSKNPYLYYALEGSMLRLREIPGGQGPTTFGGNILDEPYRQIPFYPFSKFLSYARCWFLLRYPWAFRWPIFSEILPIKVGPPNRENAFWTVFGQGKAGIEKSYEEITQNLHSQSALIRESMPKVIPLQELRDQVAENFDLSKPESRGAKRNLERAGFWAGNRYYVVDLGIIIEATVGTLTFARAGMESGFARLESGTSFIMIGMVGSTNPDTGEVRITLTPYSSLPGNPGYIYMPRGSLERLEIRDADRKIVYALPVPLDILENFFSSAKRG